MIVNRVLTIALPRALTSWGLVEKAKLSRRGGVGFRYRLARELGLQAGLDVARGPEDTSVYLTVGSAW